MYVQPTSDCSKRKIDDISVDNPNKKLVKNKGIKNIKQLLVVIIK